MPDDLERMPTQRRFASRLRPTLGPNVRRVLHYVRNWPAPPHNLLLTALVLLVFPWDYIVIDAVNAAFPTFPAAGVYLIWIIFECLLVWIVLASGGMLRPAAAYAGITALLNAITAAVYYAVREYSPLYMVALALVDISFVLLILLVMRVRLGEKPKSAGFSARWLGLDRPPRRGQGGASAQHPSAPSRQRAVPLFNFVVPLIVSIGVAYAASFCAALTCTGSVASHRCGPYGPPIHLSFFDQAAHIIAILLVAVAIEARLLFDHREREERALVSMTLIAFAVGIAASLTAAAANAETLPLAFPLTVQALALGLTTILMLPYLSTTSSPSHTAGTDPTEDGPRHGEVAPRASSPEAVPTPVPERARPPRPDTP